MRIKTHEDLRVYQLSFKTGMKIFEVSKNFPKYEMYSLSSQIRKSSRSVSGNIAEGFRKRRYPNAFIAKMSDSEAEAAETQVWLKYALSCNYITEKNHLELYTNYDHIIGMLVNMINKPGDWLL